MARTPRAKVSKTSGQGVSRLSYQKGYALGNRGTASPDGGKSPSVPSEKGGSSGGGSSGRASKAKIDKAGGMNISYGDVINPSNLVDIETLAKRKPPKAGGFAKLGKPVKFKAGKDSSGFLKGKK
jgi:hypothetical protein